jgi:hypothetical protein
MNFLQLCQELVTELGLAGGTGPSTVLDQRGELRNVVRWIRDSCLWIDSEWKDWKYLRCDYDGVIQVNSREPTPPNNPSGVKVRKWDRDSLILNYGSVNAKPLIWENWATFRKLRQIGSAYLTIDEPAVFSTKQDGYTPKLILYPTANATYPIHGEFWRRPPVLTNDTDVPLMPEEYHRLIMATAAIKYGNREDAPEIIAGFEAEHHSLLMQLKADQLESFETDNEAGQDLVLEGAIPGEDWGNG